MAKRTAEARRSEGRTRAMEEEGAAGEEFGVESKVGSGKGGRQGWCRSRSFRFEWLDATISSSINGRTLCSAAR